MGRDGSGNRVIDGVGLADTDVVGHDTGAFASTGTVVAGKAKSSYALGPWGPSR
ncbi:MULTISPECIES: hypothetical protein [unclassified Streptomyces]|uniref:hypothetical protein n=1 Tax=unclassified Streptomyces TaxID=2593676 RepID=UPI001650E90D|nr:MULTISPECIES: hypothetical protein [unclassified Streptomyces]